MYFKSTLRSLKAGWAINRQQNAIKRAMQYERSLASLRQRQLPLIGYEFVCLLGLTLFLKRSLIPPLKENLGQNWQIQYIPQ